MKKYKEYMDTIKASDTLHQRLVGLEEPGKRPVGWKKYGSMAAALVLIAGLSAWGLSKSGGWAQIADQLQRDPQFESLPGAEIVQIEPDIAIVDPNDMDEPAEKTLGGYDVTYGSGSEAVVAHYILPCIEYGDAGNMAAAVKWDIPPGAVRRDLPQDEIIALMGGEDAVNTHLDWGGYELTGWAAWYEDGSFWGACINGLGPGVGNSFELAVMAGESIAYIGLPSSVTQKVRGLTVTADKHDWDLDGERLWDIPDRRVSFFKEGYGYRFTVTSGDTEQAELLVSRLVCRIADEGLDAVDTHAEMGSSICDVCGEEIVPGTKHFHSWTGADEVICPDCGQTVTDNDRAHVHSFAGEDDSVSTAPYDPNEAADPQYHAPAVSADPVESQEICGYPLVPDTVTVTTVD